MTTRRPAEVFPPGEFLREELEERGWTQNDLAEILGRPVRTVNEIIVGKRGITPETAKGLAAALGTTPELWMNLEAAYQLWRVRSDGSDSITRRARLYTIAPIKDMLRRGWIEPSDNIDVLEKRVLSFFGLKSIVEEPVFLPHAARRSGSYAEITPAQTAWLFRALHLSQSVHAAEFLESGLEEAVGRLRLLLHNPLEVRHVPRILSEAGVRFVVVEHLPGTRIDGASFWVEGCPVVALSLRYDRIDNFWFTLMHEIGHLRNKDSALDLDMETVRDSSERPENERLADNFATERLVLKHQLDDFIARVRPIYSSRRIEAFAQTMQVHPGIVVGQLQHRGEIVWANFRRLLVPIRQMVIAAALTDGWGATLSIQTMN